MSTLMYDTYQSCIIFSSCQAALDFKGELLNGYTGHIPSKFKITLVADGVWQLAWTTYIIHNSEA